jgi:hypothetical protein
MLSSRYTFKSNEIKYSYINGFIDYQVYLSLLEDIKKEELRSVVFDFKQREMEEEVCEFEVQQMNEANHERSIRKKNEDILRLQIEAERTKQLEAIRQQEAEEAKMQPQTLEEKLLEARENFYENDARQIIEEYKGNARKYRKKHDRRQMAVIVCSSLATSTTGATIFTGATNLSTGLKIIATIFSLIVTIASGSIAYFKYKERSNDTQKAADKIEDEHNALKLGTGIYRGRSIEESLSIFAENTNSTISEHKKQQQLLDQPPDVKSVQVSQ